MMEWVLGEGFGVLAQAFQSLERGKFFQWSAYGFTVGSYIIHEICFYDRRMESGGKED
jgi:hypothetical protein